MFTAADFIIVPNRNNLNVHPQEIKQINVGQSHNEILQSKEKEWTTETYENVSKSHSYVA